jgi:hypothetical protein
LLRILRSKRKKRTEARENCNARRSIIVTLNTVSNMNESEVNSGFSLYLILLLGSYIDNGL